MDDSPKGYWQKQDFPKLRAPQSMEESQETSKLSADAKEWYPPGYLESKINPPNYDQSQNHQVSNKSSVQNRLARPQINNQLHNEHIIPDYDSKVEYLQEIFYELTADPGRFDDVSGVFLSFVSKYFDDEEMLDHTAKCIVDQAIAHSNFAYTGARLSVMLKNNGATNFQTNLVSYFSTLHFDPVSSQATRNYTMFLGELVSQFEKDPVFHKHLLSAFNMLLNNSEPEDIKCLCQCLKLTGSHLERRASLNDLMQRLSSNIHLFPTCKDLLASVQNLRSNRWGVSLSPIAPNDVPVNDNSVIYPSEIELSAEENAFIMENFPEYQHDEDDDLYWDEDPEKDEEMKAAFNEFLAMKKN